jgi:hypothetical protein
LFNEKVQSHTEASLAKKNSSIIKIFGNVSCCPGGGATAAEESTVMRSNTTISSVQVSHKEHLLWILKKYQFGF